MVYFLLRVMSRVAGYARIATAACTSGIDIFRCIQQQPSLLHRISAHDNSFSRSLCRESSSIGMENRRGRILFKVVFGTTDGPF
jgi:hypothetical protein